MQYNIAGAGGCWGSGLLVSRRNNRQYPFHRTSASRTNGGAFISVGIAAELFSIKTLDQDNRGGHNYSGSVIEQLDREGRGGHNT